MKQIVLITTTIAALAGAGTIASAQTAEFKCPAVGTEFVFKTNGPESVTRMTGQDGNVCVATSTSGGKTENLRIHWGLIGSVDAAGESYARGIDLKSLWPLKVGNGNTQTVNGTGRDGKPYTSSVTMKVAAYEKVTVPAGTFDAFRVEESKAGETVAHIHWWAPSLGFSVKETFPDWMDRSKTKAYELSAVKPGAK